MLTDEQIRERDGDRCARCGSTRDLQVHHRLLRSGGGGDEASNRVTLCASCHRWVHHNPVQAGEEGWIVSRYDGPAGVVVRHWLWPAGAVFLEDDGGIRIWTGEDRP